MRKRTKAVDGFTLLEAVAVIVITGIVAAVVAVFIRNPIKGYFDSVSRADLTDTADTAVRRIARDLHLALPNSVRVSTSGNTTALEFLSTRTGGRYRASLGTGTEDPLHFNGADTTFDILGPAITFNAGDQIVIYNLGIPGADAYGGNNIRAYSGPTGTPVTNVQITSTAAFPFASPSNRFQVVDTPVSYVCNTAAGTLTRYWGYPITTVQNNPPTGGQVALLASNVTNCTFTFNPIVTEHSDLVSIWLALTKNGETVSLYDGIHVSNVP